MKKKLKVRKVTSKKRSTFKSKLTLIVIALAIFLGGSIYMALSSGTGPFSSFLTTQSSINRITTGDPEEDCYITGGTWKNNRCTPKGQTPAKTPTPGGGTPSTAKADCEKQSTTLQRCTYTTTCKCTAITPPATTSSGKTCPGATGVNIQSGQWAASGANMGPGHESERECVKCVNGEWTSRAACHVEVAKDPSKVVLPYRAGPEYTNGKSPAQIKAEETAAIAAGQQPPAKPKEQCYDKNSSGTWVIVTDGTPKNGDSTKICGNGEFISATDYAAIKKAENKAKCLADNKHTWSDANNACSLIVVPPAVVAPTDAEKKAKAAECRGKNLDYDPAKNECGKTLKCGPGYVERAGYCDLAPGSSSENARENIIRQGETFCKGIDKKFDFNTGLCIGTTQTPSAGRPRECKSETTNISGTRNSYRFCEYDITGKVIGEKFLTCDTATSIYDSKKGTCTLKPPSAVVIPPVKTVQSASDCPKDTTPTGVAGSYGYAWNCVPKSKVGQECPKGFLSCSEFCDKNAEGRFASKPVNGKIVCDVPPPVTPKKEEVKAPVVVVPTLTSSQKSDLQNPSQAWSVFNQIEASKASDCPKDSVVTTVYNIGSANTYKCAPPAAPKEAVKPPAAPVTPVVQGPPTLIPKSDYTAELSETYRLIERAGGHVESLSKCPPADTCFTYQSGISTFYVRVKDVLDTSKKLESDLDYLNKYDEIIKQDKKAFDEGPHDYGEYTTKAQCEAMKLDCIKVTKGLFYTYVEKKAIDAIAQDLGVKDLTLPGQPPATSLVVPTSVTQPVVVQRKAGEKCVGINTDSTCESGDCRSTVGVDGKSGWYCMSKEVVEFTPGGYKNGRSCGGRNELCASGYCAKNAGFMWTDVCETNPFSSIAPKEPEKATAKEIHVENLQTKYTLINAQNPDAFSSIPTGCVESLNVTCIPVPGHPGEFMDEQYILDKARQYNISLPGDN